MAHTPLEIVYWISQIAIAIVVGAATFIALSQLKAYKLFEAIKYSQDEHFATARRIVYQKIEPVKDEEWWKSGIDTELFEAATRVCARYHALGLIIELDWIDRILPGPRYSEYFMTAGAEAIVRTYDALEGFIRHMRTSNPAQYAAYTRLRNAAASRFATPSKGGA
jgi:hypothetical protein